MEVGGRKRGGEMGERRERARGEGRGKGAPNPEGRKGVSGPFPPSGRRFRAEIRGAPARPRPRWAASCARDHFIITIAATAAFAITIPVNLTIDIIVIFYH